MLVVTIWINSYLLLSAVGLGPKICIIQRISRPFSCSSLHPPKSTSSGKCFQITAWCQFISTRGASYDLRYPIVTNNVLKYRVSTNLSGPEKCPPQSPFMVKSTSNVPWTPSWYGHEANAGKWPKKTQRCTTLKYRNVWVPNGNCWVNRKKDPLLMKRNGWGKKICLTMWGFPHVLWGGCNRPQISRDLIIQSRSSVLQKITECPMKIGLISPFIRGGLSRGILIKS